MTLSADIVTEGTVLIIKHPTGVFYEAQCNGIGCAHPSCEGFVISLHSFMEDFDDCSYGCHHIPDMPEERNRLANDLNEKLTKKTAKWRYQISFDFDRVSELMEGWWPVKIAGSLDDCNMVKGEFIGFIHTGNCD